MTLTLPSHTTNDFPLQLSRTTAFWSDPGGVPQVSQLGGASNRLAEFRFEGSLAYNVNTQSVRTRFLGWSRFLLP